MKRYSDTFKRKMVEKMLGPGAQSAHALSKETGIAVSTLSAWRRRARGGEVGDKTSQRKLPAARRSPAEKYRLVVESAGLDDEKLGAFLRREGLHEADLERLREEVSAAAIEGLSPKRRGKSPEAKELAAVKKELERKEKALAETAALLVLRGKLEAFLLGDEEGDTTKK